MSSKTTCWACEKVINLDVVECPHCGMPIEKATSEEIDLDTLMEEVTKPDSNDESDLILPDMNYVDGTTDQTITPAGEMDYATMDEPVLPDMDYVDGSSDQTITPAGEMDLTPVEETNLPDFDYIEGKTDQTLTPAGELDFLEIKEDKLIEDSSEITQDGAVEDEISEMPTWDLDEVKLDFEEELESPDKIISGSIFSLGFNKLLTLHLTQWFYWAFVLTIISFASFELISQNAQFGIFVVGQFDIHLEAFLFSWISYFVMGWFYGYKLRSNEVKPRWFYGLFFLIGLFLFISVFTVLVQQIIILQRDLIDPINTNIVIISILNYNITNFLIAGLTAGFFLFYLAYSLIWDSVYKRTPMAKLKPNLGE